MMYHKIGVSIYTILSVYASGGTHMYNTYRRHKLALVQLSMLQLRSVVPVIMVDTTFLNYTRIPVECEGKLLAH